MLPGEWWPATNKNPWRAQKVQKVLVGIVFEMRVIEHLPRTSGKSFWMVHVIWQIDQKQNKKTPKTKIQQTQTDNLFSYSDKMKNAEEHIQCWQLSVQLQCQPQLGLWAGRAPGRRPGTGADPWHSTGHRTCGTARWPDTEAQQEPRTQQEEPGLCHTQTGRV